MDHPTAIGATLQVMVLLQGALLTAQNQPDPAAPRPATTGSVTLDGDEHPSIGEALGRIRLGDWFERLDVVGFASVRAFDTGRGGARPDGAVGVDQATLFLDAGVRDIGSIYCELRIERLYDADTTGVGTGELYLSLPSLVQWGDSSLGLKVGRFDFRFGEYYMLEDAHLNRTISYPASLPYQFDEGVLATARSGDWTVDLSLSDGTRSRNSSTGVAPAVTGRVRWQPTPSLLASISGYQAGEAPLSALGFNASLAGPVNGAASGTSTSTEVSLTAGCADLIAEPVAGVHVQAQTGAARVGDDDTRFGRTFYWWTVEPWLDLGPSTMLVARYSGVGTYDDDEGYRFEGRPFANGGASYGFDLRSLDRLSLGVRHVFVPGLIGKLELGRDRLTGTRTSALPSDERSFVAAELVLVF